MQVTTELPGELVGGSDVKWVVGGRKPLVVMSNGWNWSPFPTDKCCLCCYNPPCPLHLHVLDASAIKTQCVANLKKISMQILKRLIGKH